MRNEANSSYPSVDADPSVSSSNFAAAFGLEREIADVLLNRIDGKAEEHRGELEEMICVFGKGE